MKKTIKISAILAALALVLTGCGGTPKETPLYSTGLTDEGFYEGVKASDIVELADYSSIPTTKDNLDAYVHYYISDNAPKEEIKDREVRNFDTVNIDYVGYVDGTAFENGDTKGMGTTVTVGVTSYIDDFLEQLIGHMPGDSFDVEVTFPDPYDNNPDLAGKDAVFKTTINYIEGEILYDQMDDEYVKTNYEQSQGWTSVADVENYAKKEIAANYIMENSKVGEIPANVTEHIKNLLVQGYTDQAAAYGMDLATLLGYYGINSEEELVENAASTIESEAQFTLILQAVAEKENLKVSREDLRDLAMRITGNSYYTDLKDKYGLGYLCSEILRDKTADILAEKVAVSE